MKREEVMIAIGDSTLVPLDIFINHFGTLVRDLIEEGEMVDRIPQVKIHYGEDHRNQD